MPELSFRIGEIKPAAYAAVPTIVARLHITNDNSAEERIQTISLNCQVQLEPLGRSYTDSEEAKLLDLFGERERWARTMKPMLWINTVVKVPGFETETVVDLLLPCTMDFDVAATKYFYGLDAGNIKVSVLFSGSIFYMVPEDGLQIAQIPWDREARFVLPVQVWREALQAHYPDASWLRLESATFDRLYRYKVARSISNWNQLVDSLLDSAERSEVKEALATGGGQR